MKSASSKVSALFGDLYIVLGIKAKFKEKIACHSN